MTAPLSRRRFLAGAGLTALGLSSPSLLLAACGDSGGSAGTGAGKVDLWLDIQGDANQKYFNESVAAAFEKAKPGIDLNTTFYKGEDLRRLVQTALQSRSGPDIVRGPSATQTIAWSKAHLLADLNQIGRASCRERV